MNKLINIKNESNRQLVNARELYEFLEVGQEFANWIKGRIAKYEFIEGEDFTVDKFINGKATQKDYIITVDMAKELSMVENNEKGSQARKYFISVEKEFKELSKPQTIEDLIILQAQSMKDIKQQLNEVNHNVLVAKAETTAVKEDLQNIRDVVEIIPSKTWRNETNNLIRKICFKLSDYSKPKEEVYRALQERGACDLKRRLENMRARVFLNGGSKSKADNLNFLDVIAEDKRLIEIYAAIVKEMAIKYKIA